MIAPVAATYAADHDTPSGHHDNNPGKTLADQVGDIAHSGSLTLKEKDDQIATLVHNAVLAATAPLSSPSDILKITEELAAAAAGSAPQFTHAIVDAISNIPAVTAINGALNEIKDAVVDAATKAAQAEFDSDKDRDHHHHHGDDDDDDDHHPRSPSH
jgi:hypothetical protein